MSGPHGNGLVTQLAQLYQPLCLDRTPVPLADKASALSVNPDCGEGELIEVKGRAPSQLLCEPTLNQSEDRWNQIRVYSCHQPWACVMQAITVAIVRSVKAACCPQLCGSLAKEALVNIGFAVGEPDFSSLPGGQEYSLPNVLTYRDAPNQMNEKRYWGVCSVKYRKGLSLMPWGHCGLRGLESCT